MIEKSGFIMAFLASHVAVAGGLPRVYIDVHLMAKAAEGGGLRKTEKGDGDDEKEDSASTNGSLYPLSVNLGEPLD